MKPLEYHQGLLQTNLVRYFQKAKRKRQVIIATHNANLVVNTDSEQVIVADFDRNKQRQILNIGYVCGALENSFDDNNEDSVLIQKSIRQHCWYVLECGP